MTVLAEVGSFTLLEINVALAGAVPLINALLAAFELTINGQFGLGALQVDLNLQFQAALNVQVSFGLQISNPLAGLQASLQLIGSLVAGIQASISLGLPTISAQISADISASVALTGALGIKLGGLGALIQLALQVKIPVVNLIADFTANLAAGPVVLLSFGFPSNELLADVGAQCASLFSAGLGGIAPGDAVAGIMLVTKVPSAKVGLSFLMMTS